MAPRCAKVPARLCDVQVAPPFSRQLFAALLCTQAKSNSRCCCCLSAEGCRTLFMSLVLPRQFFWAPLLFALSLGTCMEDLLLTQRLLSFRTP